MGLINFKLGDVSERASKDDFIIADDYESGTSETLPGERGGCLHLDGYLDTAHYGVDASTEEEDSWQVDTEVSDSLSESSEFGPCLGVYCLNCSERRHGTVCERCGHDSQSCPLDLMPSLNCIWSGSKADQDVAIVYDEKMMLHDKGDGRPHPERPDRLKAIMARLMKSGLADRCKKISSREATPAELLRVHSEQLLEQNKQMSMAAANVAPEGASLCISADLYVNKHTFQCAQLAAGSAAEVAAVVARRQYSGGAAIVRPPGHHAESGNAMGFCFFNNAAVAARVAQQNGARKVMIVDWDVHHGNGTQRIFNEDPSVLYVSLHRYDRGSFYPGTGGAHEVGFAAGEGYSVNIPWDYDGMGDDDYVAAFQQVILPIASEFGPDLTIVSAGFDAAEGDPLGGCMVSPEGYAQLTHLLSSVAPIVLLLEGGYNLRATALSTEACIRVLLGEKPPAITRPVCPSPFGWLGIQQAIRFQCQYWTCLTSVADVGNGWGVGSPVGFRTDSHNWISWQGQKRMGSNGGVSVPSRSALLRFGSEPQTVRASGSVSERTQHPRRGLLQGRRRALGRQEKIMKSEWRYKIILAIHNNAMKALWRRKRQLPRQSSVKSIGSLMELCSIESATSQQSTRSCQPNGVFEGANISREKLRRLHSFPSL